MVVKDDGENQRIFTAEKVAPVKKNGLDRSCSCWGASSCGGNAFRWIWKVFSRKQKGRYRTGEDGTEIRKRGLCGIFRA